MDSLLGIYPPRPHGSHGGPDLVDSLPASIENLVIFETDVVLNSQLGRVRDVKGQRSPNLRNIVFISV